MPYTALIWSKTPRALNEPSRNKAKWGGGLSAPQESHTFGMSLSPRGYLRKPKI